MFLFVQQFMFVGGEEEKREKYFSRCSSLKSSPLRRSAGDVCSSFYHKTVSFHVLLTFSLVDGGGLVGGAWVCVAFDTQQKPPTASGTGLRALSTSASSSLGCVSPAASTASRNRDNRREFGGVDAQSKNI